MTGDGRTPEHGHPMSSPSSELIKRSFIANNIHLVLIVLHLLMRHVIFAPSSTFCLTVCYGTVHGDNKNTVFIMFQNHYEAVLTCTHNLCFEQK